ncbi:hypothetical protein BD324DRAFT_616250 [Kockovaella imperatae]|uniref:Very-long-chain 3-oxoacyl-CoA synthase n=1 Tax=Kockovaella imperatae TaxID=4999 RepID=A0A1Y1UPW5_9TREE|nr:hypothetical protein BD324DRAFT_616250 [Kockovaella imperatae]ORX40098.1 hypothetical protein BD324DRAFT_616250 [Kockovaella imperatae]
MSKIAHYLESTCFQEWGYKGDDAPRTRPDMPLLDLRSIVTTTVILATIQRGLAAFVARQGKSTIAKSLLKVHASIYSCICLCLVFTSLVPESKWPTWIAGNLPDAGYIYHYSKFYEYTDVVLVTLLGYEMDWHWGFHHPTTPYLTYARCVICPDGGSWRIFAAMNSFHHWLMYAAFAGYTFGRPYMGYTGLSQLTVGVIIEVYRGYLKFAQGGGLQEIWPHGVAGTLLFIYWVFFVRMWVQHATKSSSEGKEAKGQEKEQVGEQKEE